jgi:hypothetical protein
LAIVVSEDEPGWAFAAAVTRPFAAVLMSFSYRVRDCGVS